MQKEKRWVLSFDLKEESKDECPKERGREFQITSPIYWKDLCPIQGPPIHLWNTVSEAEQREQEGE